MEDFEIVALFFMAEEKAENLNLDIEVEGSGFVVQSSEGDVLYLAGTIDALMAFLDGMLYHKTHPKI